jgi:hypothetical protein
MQFFPPKPSKNPLKMAQMLCKTRIMKTAENVG